MMIKNIILTCLILLKQGGCFAQHNLVLNPSFEDILECPYEISQLSNSIGWHNGGISGTPDLFAKCNSKKNMVGVPQNFIGYQFAHSGTAYAGIINLSAKDWNYQEHIQGKLIEPLKKDSVYEVSAYVSLADSSTYYYNTLQFGFTGGSQEFSHRCINGYYVMYCNGNCITITDDSSGLFKDSKSWRLIKGIYKAKGGEEYITIGLFKDTYNRYMHKRALKYNKINNITVDEEADAYYYIDDVCVKLMK